VPAPLDVKKVVFGAFAVPWTNRAAFARALAVPFAFVALLGVVQGLTEFLPVSSSGHLILARAFFGWDAGRFGIAFDVACHVGTLLAVVAFYRADVAQLVMAAPGALGGRDGEWERPGPLVLGRPPHHGAVADVLRHRHVGEQGVILEDRVDVPLVGGLPGDVGAVKEHCACRGLLEAGDHAQAGGLARPRGPEQ